MPDTMPDDELAVHRQTAVDELAALELELDERRCWRVKDAVDDEPRSQCKAFRVRGQPYCAGHLGLGGIDPYAGGAASAQARSGRAQARKMTVLEAAHAVLEEHADAILRNWTSQAADDWRAADALMTRVFGRPTERVELGPVTLTDEVLADPEARARLKAQLLRRHPHLEALLGGASEQGAGEGEASSA